MAFELSPEDLARFIQIESGGNPNAVTGSYSGLLQRKSGGNDIAGGKAEIEANANALADKLGRDVTPAEAYLTHNQGVGGAYAHLSNPDRPAWENMYSTKEGRDKGVAWSKQAIWGNMTPEMKAQYNRVEDVPSSAFVGDWGTRYASIRPNSQSMAAAGAGAPYSPPVGAPSPPQTSVAQAQPMGSLPAFSFTPSSGTAPSIAPSPGPPQAPAPQSPINISQFQRLTPLQWVQLFRG